MELARTFAAGLVIGGLAGMIVTAFVFALCMVAGDADERAGIK